MGIISNIFKSQVQLYEFTKGTEKFYFTSGDRDFLFQNRIYKPATIKSSSIKSSQDKTKANITITTDKDCPLGSWFKTTTPGNVKVFIWRTAKDQTNQFERVFNGSVLGADFQKNEIAFMCEPLAALTSKPICRYTYQTECGHHVYDKRCRLNIDDHSVFAKVSNIASDGVTITLSSRGTIEAGHLHLGFIQTTDNHSSMITEDDGSLTIKILTPIEGLKVGDDIRVAKGCDNSSDTCKNRFNNFENFFGFEVVPTRNIFESGLKDTVNRKPNEPDEQIDLTNPWVPIK